MFAKNSSNRRSRKLQSRKSRRRFFRPLAEQLESRLLLAHGGEFVTLEFDTTLESLDLSTDDSSPIAMPLGSDPGNVLFPDAGGGLAPDGGLASIEGYAFVDSKVTVTLSSQRAVDPGPPTLGTACAFFFGDYGGDAAALEGEQEEQNGREGCEGAVAAEGELNQHEPMEPINPDELDGHQFFVDSFFDVFFDITVTDVDSRPGRDYAGQADGASFVIEDNGPGFLQSFYNVQFNKDLPNYGLVPPPPEASSPYIGHFDIVIPLGGDINGNGENDVLKFQLASHLAGAATFITLPDGTVIDQFDSTAEILGAVQDESTDPPFTITGLSGPTTATSTLLNPVANAGFPFVDADNDGLFTAGTDVALLSGELDDGRFDTRRAEGGYSPAIPGAGLYIGGPAISVAGDIKYKADGDVKINTDLTAGDDIDLRSRDGSVSLDDPTISAPDEIEITAALDIISTAPVAELVTNGGFETGTLAGWTVTDQAGGSGSFFVDTPGTTTPVSGFPTSAAGSTGAFYAVSDQGGPGAHALTQSFTLPAGVSTATLSFDMFVNELSGSGPIVDPAGLDYIAGGTFIPNQHARVDILTAGAGALSTAAVDVVANFYLGVDSPALPNPFTAYSFDLLAAGLVAGATYQVRFAEVDNQGNFNHGVDNVSIQAIVGGDVIEATGPGSEVELKAGRDIILVGTTVTADRDVELKAGQDILVSAGSLTASDLSRGEVELRAGRDIDVSDARIYAGDEVQLIAGGSISAVDAVMSALGNSRSEIELRAAGDIDAGSASLSADDEIELRSDGGSISAVSATMEALGNSNGEVQLIAAVDINVDRAVLRANRDVELRASGGSISAIDALMEALGSSKGEIDLRAALDIDLTGADLFANREVLIRAGGTVDLTDALLDAGKKIDIKACTVIDTLATLIAPRVKIRIC